MLHRFGMVAFVLVSAMGCVSEPVASEEEQVQVMDAAVLGRPNAGPPVRTVREGQLYRGPHPSRETLMDLKRRGVRRIVSLEQPNGSRVEGERAEEVRDEQIAARELGLEWISIPMTSWSSRSEYEATWREVLPLLASSAQTPTFVHCRHGRDRTGLLVALERVFLEGWTARAAHDEWGNLGHSSLLVRLDAYFWSKVRDEGGARPIDD